MTTAVASQSSNDNQSPTSTTMALRRKQADSKKRHSPRHSNNSHSTPSSSSNNNSNSNSNNTNKSPNKKLLQSQRDSIEKLQTNLVRYARVSNKRMVLRTLLECSYLKAIPLDTVPTPPGEWSLLEQEVSWTNVQLNGLFFRGSANSQVLKVLRALCQELTKGLRLSSEAVYLALVPRLAASSNSVDAYEALCGLLLTNASASNNNNNGNEHHDLVLQPLEEHHDNDDDLPPTDLSLYQAAGQVHAVLTSYVSFGLFQASAMSYKKKPWIALVAQLHERINLSTNTTVRQVQVQITTPE